MYQCLVNLNRSSTSTGSNFTIHATQTENQTINWRISRSSRKVAELLHLTIEPKVRSRVVKPCTTLWGGVHKPHHLKPFKKMSMLVMKRPVFNRVSARRIVVNLCESRMERLVRADP